MSSERRPGSSGASVRSQEQQLSGMPPAMGMPPQDPNFTYPKGPPSGFGGGPPPQPYAATQQQSYQPPPLGAFPPHGFSPYSYPPQMFPPGALPFGQQPPFYGFPQYPSQHQQLQDKSQEGRNGHRKSPTRRSRSPRRASSYHPRSHHDEDDQQPLQVADMPSVNPMQTAFHFFAQDTMENLRQAAQDEVMRTNNGRVDLYLVNTNLNARLMKEWEDASQNLRNKYMDKEEEDRKRFMTDDEIASRHCATLTARARSPRFGTMTSSSTTTHRSIKGQKEEDNEEEGSFESDGESEEQEKRRDSPTENGESPTKKIRTDADDSDEDDNATSRIVFL